GALRAQTYLLHRSSRLRPAHSQLRLSRDHVDRAITIGFNRSIPGAFAGWIIAALWITFATQIFLSIRRVFRQGWFFTVFKFFLGGFAYLVVLTVALATTFFITIALP